LTERTANAIADGILVAAVVGAGYAVWRVPRLRRMAAGLLLASLTGAVPAWISRELQEAWAASGQPQAGARPAI
jgi:hypothetical protein